MPELTEREMRALRDPVLVMMPFVAGLARIVAEQNERSSAKVARLLLDTLPEVVDPDILAALEGELRHITTKSGRRQHGDA